MIFIALLTINGKVADSSQNGIKEPSSYQVEIYDIDAEGNRNANGQLYRDRVATKRKILLEWNALKTAEIAQILQAVAPESVSVTFLDPQIGEDVTKTMYAGEKSTPVAIVRNNEVIWHGLSLNLIEF